MGCCWLSVRRFDLLRCRVQPSILWIWSDRLFRFDGPERASLSLRWCRPFPHQASSRSCNQLARRDRDYGGNVFIDKDQLRESRSFNRWCGADCCCHQPLHRTARHFSGDTQRSRTKVLADDSINIDASLGSPAIHVPQQWENVPFAIRFSGVHGDRIQFRNAELVDS